MYLFEVGQEVMVDSSTPGVVSFIDKEFQIMSILIGRGCHRSEDTKLIIMSWELSRVEKGWPDRKLGEEALTPRPCSWYSSKRDSNR